MARLWLNAQITTPAVDLRFRRVLLIGILAYGGFCKKIEDFKTFPKLSMLFRSMTKRAIIFKIKLFHFALLYPDRFLQKCLPANFKILVYLHTVEKTYKRNCIQMFQLSCVHSNKKFSWKFLKISK
jgi:hypothetical protein